MDTILVNKLPTRTWNRLGVNETVLLWDEAGTVDGGTELLSADGRLELSAHAPYTRKTVEITAAPGQRVTVYETFRGGEHLHVRTVLRPAAGAVIRLVQVQAMDAGAVLRSEVAARCPEGSSVELYRLLPGRGDTYADDRLTLADGASLKAAMGYLGRDEQVIDLNLAVDHVGQNTRSDIDVSGALSGTSGEGSSGLRSGLSHVSMITSIVSMSMRRISCAIWLWRSLVAVSASSRNALTRWARCLRSVLCTYSARWRNEVCPVPT